MSDLDFRTSVNEYLEGLPESILGRLYQAPSTCLAVFRLLPPVSKQFVLKALFLQTPISITVFDSYIQQSGIRKKHEAVENLTRLHVLRIKKDLVTINKTFRANLTAAFTGGGEASSFGVPCDVDDKHKVDIEFLDEHAKKQWELILHFMVGTVIEEVPNEGALSLLQHSKLMEPDDETRGLRITNLGFQFLLQDVGAQIWTLLLQYLNMSERLNMDPVEVLQFIFMLGSLELGQDYSSAQLSETQLNMLEDLRDYGIVYQRKSSSRRFYPTRLATSLTSDVGAQRSASSAFSSVLAAGIQQSQEQRFIILETNYRMYAYTDSPLQIAIIHLFTHLRSRYPNMVTGQITRESVRRALKNGITADQIITYLSVHAHPQMAKAASEKTGVPAQVLPPTVVDQIKLWQIEMERMSITEGYLFTDFANHKEYDLVVTYADELGVVRWKSDTSRKFFVSKEGVSPIVEFVNRRLKS